MAALRHPCCWRGVTSNVSYGMAASVTQTPPKHDAYTASLSLSCNMLTLPLHATKMSAIAARPHTADAPLLLLACPDMSVWNRNASASRLLLSLLKFKLCCRELQLQHARCN